MKLKIISDGTNAGTKLVNAETGEMVNLISKITWGAMANEALTTASVELFNIPVEITTKAIIETLDTSSKPISQELKNITIKSEASGKGTSQIVKICDKETGEAIPMIQEINWEASPSKREATIYLVKLSEEQEKLLLKTEKEETVK